MSDDGGVKTYPGFMLTRFSQLSVCVLCSALMALCPVAAATAQQTPDLPVFRTSTAAVTVDVIVRDNKGDPVLGLTRDDFEVLEDGAPQRLISFDAVAPRPAVTRTGDQPPMIEESAGSPSQSIVAIVFHRLAHQSRVMAADAVRSMISALPQHEYAGLFVMDLTLKPLSPFTRNVRDLEQGLDALRRTPPVSVGPSAAPGIAESNGPPGQLSRDAQQAAELSKRLEAGLEGPQHAAAQAASLTDLIALLQRFPGRKTVILFSEGLDVSPRLESVVDRARAENVSVYTIHAGGLGSAGRIVPPHRAPDARELTGSSRSRRGSWQRAFPEMDPTAGLAPLAQHTGGFMVSDTNDLAAALSTVNEDRGAYYVLAYSSTNETRDDKPRQIEVRVNRPGLSVRARTGYRAGAPDTAEHPSYEQTVLEALADGGREQIDFVVRAYSTPKPGRTDLLSIFLEVPACAVTFREDGARRKYAGDVLILTRLLDGSRVVAAQSQRYVLTGDLPRLQEFKSTRLPYLRTIRGRMVRTGSKPSFEIVSATERAGQRSRLTFLKQRTGL